MQHIFLSNSDLGNQIPSELLDEIGEHLHDQIRQKLSDLELPTDSKCFFTSEMVNRYWNTSCCVCKNKNDAGQFNEVTCLVLSFGAELYEHSRTI